MNKSTSVPDRLHQIELRALLKLLLHADGKPLHAKELSRLLHPEEIDESRSKKLAKCTELLTELQSFGLAHHLGSDFWIASKAAIMSDQILDL